METVRHRILSVWMCAVLLLSAVSCAHRESPQTATTEATSEEAGNSPSETFDKSQAVALTDNGASPYLIIRSADSSDSEKKLAETVRSAILERSGVRLPSVTDDSVAAKNSQGFEILIGKTNRAESQAAAGLLRNRDYSVTVSGTRVLLSGESDYMLQVAVNAFLDGLIMQDEILYSTCQITVCGSYPVSEMTANGVAIEQYRIVYAEGTSLAFDLAQDIAQLLCEQTGWQLKCVPDREAETAYEILVGETNRSESKEVGATLTRNEIAMCMQNGKFVFAYADPYIANALTAQLSNALLQDLKAEEHELANLTFRTEVGQMPIPDGTEISVMSFNILGVGSLMSSCYNRDDLAASVIRSYLPDIIGLQEFDAPFRLEQTSVFDLLEGVYTEAVCEGTEPDRNWNPILYRSDRLELISCGNHAFTQGTEWPLAETYPSESKVTHHRTMTWAVFRIMETGEQIIVLNAHFHVDDRMTASESEAILISEANEMLAKAKELKNSYPDAVVFAIGDFNSTASGAVMQHLSAGGFVDAYALAAQKTDVCGFHGRPDFNSLKNAYDRYDATFPVDGYQYAIDHCMILGDAVKVENYHTVTLRDAMLVSDHCPLLCRVYLGDS